MDDWDRETDERMAADEAQAMRELKEEAELRKNGTYPVQANSRWVPDPFCKLFLPSPPLRFLSDSRVWTVAAFCGARSGQSNNQILETFCQRAREREVWWDGEVA